MGSIFSCCESQESDGSIGTYISNGIANGKSIFQGPKGGRYYVNSSGNKSYI